MEDVIESELSIEFYLDVLNTIVDRQIFKSSKFQDSIRGDFKCLINIAETGKSWQYRTIYLWNT